MLASLKRLTKHSAVYGIGNIVTRLVTFLLLPLHTNQLNTNDFGVLAIVYLFIAIMTIVYTYGIDAAFLRYFILSDDPKQRKRVFSTAFWAVLVVAGLLTALIYRNAEFCSSLLISQGNYDHLILLIETLVRSGLVSYCSDCQRKVAAASCPCYPGRFG